MGTLSSPARTALLTHYRDKGNYTPAATHYAHAYAGGSVVSEAPASRPNDATTYGAPSGRAVTNVAAFTFANPTTNWGNVDEIRITDNATPGAGLELARHTLSSPVTINTGTGPLTIPIGDIDITAPAGCHTDTVIHELLGLMFGAIANSPRATVHGTYFVGNPQSGGSETSAARTAITQATTWGAASAALAITTAPIALADESDATYYAEFSASSGGTLLFSLQLPAGFTPPSGGIIPAGGLRHSFT